MKTKRVRTLLIGGLLVLSVLLVFTATVAAETDEDPFMIYGTILDANGDPVVGCDVEILKQHDLFGEIVWMPLVGVEWPGLEKPQLTTDVTGYYSTGWCFLLGGGGVQGYGYPLDNYRMYLDGSLVETKDLTDMQIWEGTHTIYWKHQWNYQIPEFATIAMPAASILGLLLFFRHRKRRKE